MGFDPIGQHLIMAAQKYKLGQVVASSLVCEKARQLIAKDYPRFVEKWFPHTFKDRKLVIKVKDSASSSMLFMETNNFLEEINKLELPQKIREIGISRE